MPGNHTISIPAGTLGSALDRTICAAGHFESGDSRADCVWLFASKETVDLVATDRRRLAWARIKLENAVDRKKQIRLSKSLAKQIQGLCHEMPRTACLKFIAGRKRVVITGTRSDKIKVAFQCPLVEGRIPPYRKLIPKTFSSRASLNRDNFTRILRCFNSKSDPGIVTLLFSKGRCILRGSRSGKKPIKSAVNADYYGKTKEICFNPAYLLDGVSAMPEYFYLEFNNARGPALLSGDPSYRYLIMPIKPSPGRK